MDFIRYKIEKIYAKLKAVLADQNYFAGILIILVALTSFGLGRQSVVETEATNSSAGLAERSLETAINSGEEAPQGTLPNVQYVASRNGEVYHLPHCSGAQRISEANKITFSSKEEAEAAGYRPAANCKGI